MPDQHPDRHPDQQRRDRPEDHPPPRLTAVPAGPEFLTSREDQDIYRCPCTQHGAGVEVVLHQADRQGRICEAPDWEDHQTVTCGRCGRFGSLLHAHPGTGQFPVIGTAELPEQCPLCLAPAGTPCQDTFCPGQHAPPPAPTAEVIDPAGATGDGERA